MRTPRGSTHKHAEAAKKHAHSPHTCRNPIPFRSPRPRHTPALPLLGPSELAAAMRGADAVVCCTGYTGLNPSGFGQVDEAVSRTERLDKRGRAKGRELRQRNGRGGTLNRFRGCFWGRQKRNNKLTTTPPLTTPHHPSPLTTHHSPPTSSSSKKGTINLVDASKKAGVRRFVLVTSLLTNAREVGQADNPNFKFLNLFGGEREMGWLVGGVGFVSGFVSTFGAGFSVFAYPAGSTTATLHNSNNNQQPTTTTIINRTKRRPRPQAGGGAVPPPVRPGLDGRPPRRPEQRPPFGGGGAGGRGGGLAVRAGGRPGARHL